LNLKCIKIKRVLENIFRKNEVLLNKYEALKKITMLFGEIYIGFYEEFNFFKDFFREAF
jgi:hypothetical protein